MIRKYFSIFFFFGHQHAWPLFSSLQPANFFFQWTTRPSRGLKLGRTLDRKSLYRIKSIWNRPGPIKQLGPLERTRTWSSSLEKKKKKKSELWLCIFNIKAELAAIALQTLLQKTHNVRLFIFFKLEPSPSSLAKLRPLLTMRRPKSKEFRKQQRLSEENEIQLLESWIQSQQPESGSNPMSLPPLPKNAPVGRVDDESFSRYAGVVRFDQLPLSKKTKDGLRDAKFVSMTEIQRASLPHALCGRDILGAAKTGSGKTLAFIIPVSVCWGLLI